MRYGEAASMRSFLLVFTVVVIFSAAISVAEAEEIIFATKDSVSIAGSFYPAPVSPAPAVVLVHMLRKNRSSWTDIALTLQKNGFSVLTFDLRGHGQSTQTKRGPISEASFSESDFANMKYDLSAAVQWLRVRPDVIPSKVAVIGASIGANVAINFAVEDRAISAVVLLSPGAVYRGIYVEPAVKSYLPRPLFIVAAEDDNFSAVTVRELMPLFKDEKVVALFEDGGHGTYLLRSRPELIPMILDFIRSYMR
ncbi:alpha/beta fold hydrolase [candidate division KSB1 bacterium]|nr:MAG: alpha/beta fold hydrolase [candidate division KSB1 bacterium]